MLHHLLPHNIVAVDLNNTLMNQVAGIIEASRGCLQPSDFSQWDVDLSHKMNMSQEEYLKWAWGNPAIELQSPAFNGTARQLAHIHASGRQIWIVTATVMRYDEIAGWLSRNGIVYDRIIKTKDKRGVGDILIDDSPTTCQLFADEGLPILRYELPWNSHLKTVTGLKWQ